MREYEFRGKRVDNNEWHYGFYREFTMLNCWKSEAYKDGINYYIDAKQTNECHLVIPETVTQSIGIKDIHQKKVFQGDIVKLRETIYTDCSREEIQETREFTGEIVWYQYGWYVAKKIENGIRYHSLWLWNIECEEGEEDDTMEIVGNRWDNPKMAVII